MGCPQRGGAGAADKSGSEREKTWASFCAFGGAFSLAVVPRWVGFKRGRIRCAVRQLFLLTRPPNTNQPIPRSGRCGARTMSRSMCSISSAREDLRIVNRATEATYESRWHVSKKVHRMIFLTSHEIVGKYWLMSAASLLESAPLKSSTLAPYLNSLKVGMDRTFSAAETSCSSSTST